ncbi:MULTISPECIES: glycerophosphoryl diester phosphodiesterase membrane domain-containing protein [Pedobacter]|uniref:Glycerophosphoryl diester phosphodiesterase membrane domain-containing protein n=1 Tax=Pedobacter heparinus (strain ATCC 13125 / DSM 2366 / CIP 104194 / JCM 7457 / NBRC 12017 / NCIMB 9290 / NRRL B-14731 / HIM 762-3) TaxID=485917 RepID=C6XYX8_PEDHD|nr:MULTISPECIES: hypothetical protein [Pedobacter]ACU02460.1 hypothetical protein Phep_0234 [Pedobacter heparinus DSM 2366]MBB5440146.1 hypothetical protein [Pedobacter sp. AK017]
MTEKLEFKKLREFGEIINDTFLFIKQNFKPLLKVFVYFCGFFIIAGTVTAVMQQMEVKQVAFGNAGGGNPFGVSRVTQLFTINYLLVFVFSMASYTSIYVAVLSYIALYMQKGKVAPTPDEVWAYFKYYFFRVFFSSIGITFFFVFCFLLCLVPGIYVFPAMSLFFPVMVLENKGFTDSFSRSFQLLKEQWWVTAGAILIIYVITYASMSLASMPAILLTMVSVFTKGANGLSNTVIILSSVIQHLCYVFLIVPVIGCTLCYFNLAERQESAGLMDRINQLGEKKDDFKGLEEY